MVVSPIELKTNSGVDILVNHINKFLQSKYDSHEEFWGWGIKYSNLTLTPEKDIRKVVKLYRKAGWVVKYYSKSNDLLFNWPGCRIKYFPGSNLMDNY